MSLAHKAIACGLSAALAFGAATVAFADPQSELDAARERMESLGGELASLQSDLSELTTQLERTDNQMANTQQDIDATQVQLDEARQVLSKHMRSGYKSGGFDPLEFVLSSSSLEDLVSRIYYMEKVTNSEAAQIAQVNALQDELESQMIELEGQRVSQEERVNDAQAKVAEYQQLVGEAQAYYNELDAQIQAELAAAAAAEAAAAEAAAAEAQAQQAANISTAISAVEEAEAPQEEAEPAAEEVEAEDTQEEEATQTEDTVVYEEPSYDDSADDSSDYSSDGCFPGGGVASAYSCIGWPYVWGGYGPWDGGFDCSGLVSYCYGDGSWRRGCESLAYAIQNAGLWQYGMENLSYGDLLFTDSEYNHVGIYIGGGMMIHSPTFGRTVCVDTVWSCYGGGPFVMP